MNTAAVTDTVLPPQYLAFAIDSREYLRITRDGRIELGEGLSADEATQATARMLVDYYRQYLAAAAIPAAPAAVTEEQIERALAAWNNSFLPAGYPSMQDAYRAGIRAALAAAAIPAEPVAWLIEDLILPQTRVTLDADFARQMKEYRYEGKPTSRVTPLYAAPPAAEPVADGLRDALQMAVVAMTFARALPGVAKEYDFDPAIATARAALSPEGRA